MSEKARDELRLKLLNADFSVCKTAEEPKINPAAAFCFTARTDEEHSLVCQTGDVPAETIEREDGWKAFRIQGTLDFSLIGILAGIAGVLAENKIGIFVISTFNTDYVLVKRENLQQAVRALQDAGYVFEK